MSRVASITASAAFPVAGVLDWYAAAARDLPWRRPDRTPWGVLVSEVMLQQTPVVRVEPAWHAWLERWPTPAALAAEPAGEAVRMWGRLGYPRRALRLHAAAVAMTERHGGAVPTGLDDLLALPGVGSYTARAVASFAFGQRHAVVDTNVHRVLHRVLLGEDDPGPQSPARDLALAEAVVPAEAAVAAVFAVAVMELGAVVCTARAPACDVCPIAADCSWLAAGRPAAAAPKRKTQAWHGTDRQVRGRLMAVVREAEGPVDRVQLDAVGGDDEQRARCLASLVKDGLTVTRDGGGTYQLP